MTVHVTGAINANKALHRATTPLRYVTALPVIIEVEG
jgi:hypothetical protein